MSRSEPLNSVVEQQVIAGEEPKGPKVFHFGPFSLDLAVVQLTRGAEAIPLASRAFDTLVVLIRHRDRVVGKDELMSLVWPKSFVSEDSLAHNISVLRRALGDDSNQPEYIATIPRRGYRFVAAVTEEGWLVAPADQPAADRHDVATVDPIHGAPATPHAVVSDATVARAPRLTRLLLPLAAVAALAALAFGITRFTASPPPDPPATAAIRFAEHPPLATRLVDGGAMSPDGRLLVFAAQNVETNRTHLWLRDFASSESRLLEGTEDASHPFWSPDGQWIGFFANYRLRRTSPTGGVPMTIATVGLNTTGATWGSGGQILFGTWRSGIFSVPASGGEVTAITTLDPAAREGGHRAPQFLPDGNHFLYYASSANPQVAGTYVASLAERSRVRLLGDPAIFAGGYLLSVRDRALLAQPFDERNLRVTGNPLTLEGNIGNVAIETAVSAGNNLLAFRGNTSSGRLVWLNRAGERQATVDTPLTLHNPQLTPDQKQLLADSGEGERRGVWLVDLERGSATQVAEGVAPIAMPDGSRYVFVSDRAGVTDIYARPVSGGNDDVVMLKSGEPKSVNDISPDGRYVVFTSRNVQTRNDIWLLETADGAAPSPYVRTPANEIQAQVSPDGRWLAYASDESGTWDVYLQTFPTPGAKRTLSVGGGAQPQWRVDGRELFYLGTDGRLMTVAIAPGENVQVGRPRALFRAPVVGNLGNMRNRYVVSADGDRFLFDAVDESNEREPITVIVNWRAALRP